MSRPPKRVGAELVPSLDWCLIFVAEYGGIAGPTARLAACLLTGLVVSTSRMSLNVKIYFIAVSQYGKGPAAAGTLILSIFSTTLAIISRYTSPIPISRQATKTAKPTEWTLVVHSRLATAARALL